MPDREHEDLLTTATDRFERRLAEECSSVRAGIGQVRVDLMAQGAEIRLEMAKLRVDMTEQDAATRQDIASLRLDMSEQFAASRIHSETRHRELLKWALVFWVGQAASVAALVSAFS